MSFSSRVIADTPPPLTTGVRALGLVLWTAPVLISMACVALAPRPALMSQAQARVAPSSAKILASATPTAALQALPTPAPEAARTPNEDERFSLARPLTLHLPVGFTLRQPTTVASIPATQPTPVASAPHAPVEARVAGAEAPTGPLIEERAFRSAKAIAANVILADGLRIVLAGVEEPAAEANCRRLDGVMQPCRERAEHRLGVLVQARQVSCKVSKPGADGSYLGRCRADRIDIADDLLRAGLGRRPSAQARAGARAI